MSEWISVEDRVPRNGENVIVVHDWGDRKSIDIEYWSEKFYMMNCITHWQPLPDLPK